MGLKVTAFKILIRLLKPKKPSRLGTHFDADFCIGSVWELSWGAKSLLTASALGTLLTIPLLLSTNSSFWAMEYPFCIARSNSDLTEKFVLLLWRG